MGCQMVNSGWSKTNPGRMVLEMIVRAAFAELSRPQEA